VRCAMAHDNLPIHAQRYSIHRGCCSWAGRPSFLVLERNATYPCWTLDSRRLFRPERSRCKSTVLTAAGKRSAEGEVRCSQSSAKRCQSSQMVTGAIWSHSIGVFCFSGKDLHAVEVPSAPGIPAIRGNGHLLTTANLHMDDGVGRWPFRAKVFRATRTEPRGKGDTGPGYEGGPYLR
jgi:hypothetical protein